jgi:hypothetical protein
MMQAVGLVAIKRKGYSEHSNMIQKGRTIAITKNKKSLFQLASNSAERTERSVPSAATPPQRALAASE